MRRAALPWRRRAVGAAFVALAGAAFALPVACAPTPTASCDLERLRHYPLAMAVENRALPLRLPDVFFPDPAGRDPGLDRDSLDAAGAAKLRAALERGLAGFRPGERPVLMLAAFDHWTAQGAGLKGFFVLPEGVFLDDVLETLDGAGLSEHAALVREGAALFGPRYGTQAERYARWSDGGGEIRDPALDAALDRLAERFRALPRPLDEAVRRVERSPDLAASYETLRAGTDADDRLRFLTGGLWRCLDHYGTPPAVAARLAALPTAHGRIIVTEIFQAEMLNGSVHQFFFNSSGGLAPDVADALDAMDLPGHAAAVRRGIAKFPSPFPRDLNTRRAFMARQDKAFDDALYELTGDVDDGKMQEAMVRIAREADILPR